jgi:hypothetical protein
MNPIKVLIMCQRKKSYIYEVPIGEKLQDALAVDITVKKIKNYVYNYYGTRNVDIEYMTKYRSDVDLYDADYKMLFEPNSPHGDIAVDTHDFIYSHNNYYDMIMLQTCPLSLFEDNIRYLPLIMKSSGVLTIQAFNPYHEVNVKINPYVHETIIKYFYSISENTFKMHVKDD